MLTMKKYLLLGLILMLLAPSPLSARKLILVLYENCIDLETLKENIYFDGGTYRGTGSFVDPDYPYNSEFFSNLYLKFLRHRFGLGRAATFGGDGLFL